MHELEVAEVNRKRVSSKTSKFPCYIAPEFLQYLGEDEIREGHNNETSTERKFLNENLYCLRFRFKNARGCWRTSKRGSCAMLRKRGNWNLPGKPVGRRNRFRNSNYLLTKQLCLLQHSEFV